LHEIEKYVGLVPTCCAAIILQLCNRHLTLILTFELRAKHGRTEKEQSCVNVTVYNYWLSIIMSPTNLISFMILKL